MFGKHEVLLICVSMAHHLRLGAKNHTHLHGATGSKTIVEVVGVVVDVLQEISGGFAVMVRMNLFFKFVPGRTWGFGLQKWIWNLGVTCESTWTYMDVGFDLHACLFGIEMVLSTVSFERGWSHRA